MPSFTISVSTLATPSLSPRSSNALLVSASVLPSGSSGSLPVIVTVVVLPVALSVTVTEDPIGISSLSPSSASGLKNVPAWVVNPGTMGV